MGGTEGDFDKRIINILFFLKIPIDKERSM